MPVSRTAPPSAGSSSGATSILRYPPEGEARAALAALKESSETARAKAKFVLATDGSNTHEVIAELFRALNTPGEDHVAAGVPRWAAGFPYVNGGLFSAMTEVLRFDRIARYTSICLRQHTHSRTRDNLMTVYPVRNLKITNYKSIDSLKLEKLTPFSVFAGANGSGKSNFFDAMEFVTRVLRLDANYALRKHGGYDNIRSLKRYSPRNQRFEFEIECDLPEPSAEDGELATATYKLVMHDLHGSPIIEERFQDGGTVILSRPKRSALKLLRGTKLREIAGFARGHSGLLFLGSHPLSRLLTNMIVYRFDPIRAKQPDPSDADPTALWEQGNNLATVLQRIEADEKLRDVISDWMETIVPGITGISTRRQRIDQTTAVLFKEDGTRKQFPAQLMSDGTIYALCLLVAVLDRHEQYGITLIEEPERGLHPSAIGELVGFLRDSASPSNPIWLTTHSESVVRQLRLEELVLVDKVAGRTCVKRADSGNLSHSDFANTGLDGAWLSNLLGGGLPW